MHPARADPSARSRAENGIDIIRSGSCPVATCMTSHSSPVRRFRTGRLCAASGVRPLKLYRRARHRRVGAENTTIASFWPQDHTAARAIIEKLARIGWHGLGLCSATSRTGDCRFKDCDTIRHRNIQDKAGLRPRPNRRKAPRGGQAGCRRHWGRRSLPDAVSAKAAPLRQRGRAR